MSDTFLEAVLYLISTVFNLYIILLVIRLILAWVGAENTHPLTQFIVKATSFIIRPLKKYIPDYRGFEFSTVLVIFIIEIIKYLLIFMLTFGFPNILGLMIIAFADSIKLLLDAFFYAILFQFVLSLIQANAPVYRLLYQFTSPLLSPIQRIVPPISNIDISPLIACVILQLLNIVVVNKLMSIGLGISIIGL